MYNQKFFENQQLGSLNSAKVVVPLALELVPAKSVVDVGCGTGTWLSEFIVNGVTDVMGVDGPWVQGDMLRIPADNFIKADLTQPLNISRKFDLATSLEVAEHLDEKYADTFVESLVNLAPVVLFSAAIPHQGGTHHVNEQWPTYWAEKFLNKNYIVVDAIRRQVWNNNQVNSWYAQNILFFVNKDQIDRYPGLKTLLDHTYSGQLSLVHPNNGNYGVSLEEMLKRRIYEYIINPAKKAFGRE